MFGQMKKIQKEEERWKGEVDYNTKAGTAWSHNFLNQKPWHPLSYPNQRRKWIAEQTDAQRQRRAQEVSREFAQEQEFFRQTALVSKKEKEKVEIMKAVSFMYVRPPGYNAESAKAAEIAEERKMLEQNNPPQDSTDGAPSVMSGESMPGRNHSGEEKRKPRPKDVFGRALPTEEEFEVLKNAPRALGGSSGQEVSCTEQLGGGSQVAESSSTWAKEAEGEQVPLGEGKGAEGLNASVAVEQGGSTTVAEGAGCSTRRVIGGDVSRRASAKSEENAVLSKVSLRVKADDGVVDGLGHCKISGSGPLSSGDGLFRSELLGVVAQEASKGLEPSLGHFSPSIEGEVLFLSGKGKEGSSCGKVASVSGGDAQSLKEDLNKKRGEDSLGLAEVPEHLRGVAVLLEVGSLTLRRRRRVMDRGEASMILASFGGLAVKPAYQSSAGTSHASQVSSSLLLREKLVTSYEPARGGRVGGGSFGRGGFGVGVSAEGNELEVRRLFIRTEGGQEGERGRTIEFQKEEQSQVLEKCMVLRFPLGFSFLYFYAMAFNRGTMVEDPPLESWLETGLPARAKPFGVEVRNVKCVRCGNFGHQSGDRECPLRDVIMPNEESRLKRDDPLTAILAQTDSSEISLSGALFQSGQFCNIHQASGASLNFEFSLLGQSKGCCCSCRGVDIDPFCLVQEESGAGKITIRLVDSGAKAGLRKGITGSGLKFGVTGPISGISPYLIHPLKWELKQKPGISPPRGGFKPDDPNQQIVAEDIFDEYGGFLGGGNIPDLLTNFSLGKAKKNSKSKRKHKSRSSAAGREFKARRKRRSLLPSDSDADRERKLKKKKMEKKHKNKKQHNSEWSSSDNSESDRHHKRSKHQGSISSSSDNSESDEHHRRTKHRRRHHHRHNHSDLASGSD
ncbi:hypothetical protein HHK36_028346 [Tetracentron sinense]|uniref:CBF1-interacting co-repressor CIR N-terminal domain-containing protein n=1 Tax=Tetracentron sinense TaxID=13715 RepID=A0A834YJS4_TETSI|nr:hypothetical protein HHK36_028346 [Tetracentron sinense]